MKCRKHKWEYVLNLGHLPRLKFSRGCVKCKTFENWVPLSKIPNSIKIRIEKRDMLYP